MKEAKTIYPTSIAINYYIDEANKQRPFVRINYCKRALLGMHEPISST